MTLPEHGRVFRDGTATVVEIAGKTHLLKEPGVTCLNPEAPEAERIYQKRFLKKRIYLPNELDQAKRDHLEGRDVFVVAINGYSALGEEKCRQYGIRPGAYEEACGVLLNTIAQHLRTHIPDIDVRFVHGSSDMGVDRAAQKTARAMRRPELGFSCPEYMFYVIDDEHPVYVAATVDEYSRSFVQACTVLIAANGRLQAYRMDIAAVFEYDKHLIPVNILRMISTNGGPPAKDANGKIEDAVAHYEQRVFMIGQWTTQNGAIDRWGAALKEVCDVALHISRHTLPSDIAWKVQ